MMLQTDVIVTGAQVFFSAILALATVILAWVTRQYATEAESQTAEMVRTRKANFRPVLKSTIEMWTNLHHRFTFRNTGKGAAHDVTARWGFDDVDYEEEWCIPLISPGDEHNFAFPFGDDPEYFMETDDLEQALDDDSTLYFEAEYSDPLGNVYETNEAISVLEIVRSGAQVEHFQADELKQIRKELEDIEDDLSA